MNPRLRAPERAYWVEPAQTWQKYGAILRGEAPHPRDRNYREHWRLLSRVKPSGRLLDIGTHCGFFLRHAREMQWELHGVEPSPTSAQVAREAFGLDVRTGFVQDVPLTENSFDIVTLVDVFEHVTRPRDLLKQVHRILKPGGVLFIKVPNGRYNLLKEKLLRRFLRLRGLDIFDSREHVVHYTTETLDRLLRDAGLGRTTFYVPMPIQSGAMWKRAGRAVAFELARLQRALTGRLGGFATDIAALAWKPDE